MTHKIHFVGKFNQQKSKLFWLLTTAPNTWYSPRQMSFVTGVPLQTCRAQARRLHNMSPPYIKRRMIGDKLHNYYYVYQIAVRGRRWYLHGLSNGMPLNQYLSQVVDYQQKRDANSLEGQKGGENNGEST